MVVLIEFIEAFQAVSHFDCVCSVACYVTCGTFVLA